MSDGMNRRKFLKVLGVTGGGATVMAGCSTEKVENVVNPPHSPVPNSGRR